MEKFCRMNPVFFGHGSTISDVTLPESFDVTVAWNGSEVTFTLHKSDFQPGDAQSGEYKRLFGF